MYTDKETVLQVNPLGVKHIDVVRKPQYPNCFLI